MSAKFHVFLIVAENGDEISVSHSFSFTAMQPGSRLQTRGWVACVNGVTNKLRSTDKVGFWGVGFQEMHFV